MLTSSTSGCFRRMGAEFSKKVISLIILSIVTSNYAAEISIDTLEQFDDHWITVGGPFVSNDSNTDVPETGTGNPSWYIGDSEMSQSFRAHYAFSPESACAENFVTLQLSYYSFLSAVTVFSTTLPNPYTYLTISEPKLWTDTFPIPVNLSVSNQIEISGIIMPTGYFALKSVIITYDDATCPSSPVPPETEPTLPDSTESSPVTETFETDATQSHPTTFPTSEKTTTVTPAPSTTLATTTPENPNETPATEGQESSFSTITTEVSTLISSSTDDFSMETTDCTSLSTNTNTEGTTTVYTTSDSDTSTTSSSSTANSDDTESPSTFQSTHYYQSTSDLSVSTGTTGDGLTTAGFTLPSTSTARTSSDTSGTGTTGDSLTTNHIITSTPKSNEENGLNFREIMLFIVIPAMALTVVVFIGFTYSYFTACGRSFLQGPGSQKPIPSMAINTPAANNGVTYSHVNELPRVKILPTNYAYS